MLVSKLLNLVLLLSLLVTAISMDESQALTEDHKPVDVKAKEYQNEQDDETVNNNPSAPESPALVDAPSAPESPALVDAPSAPESPALVDAPSAPEKPALAESFLATNTDAEGTDSEVIKDDSSDENFASEATEPTSASLITEEKQTPAETTISTDNQIQVTESAEPSQAERPVDPAESPMLPVTSADDDSFVTKKVEEFKGVAQKSEEKESTQSSLEPAQAILVRSPETSPEVSSRIDTIVEKATDLLQNLTNTVKSYNTSATKVESSVIRILKKAIKSSSPKATFVPALVGILTCISAIIILK